MKTWKELYETSSQEEFREILIQNLVVTKLALREQKRRWRIAEACMLAVLIASLVTCGWMVKNIKMEYRAQIQIMQDALKKNAGYKKIGPAEFDILIIKQE